MKPKDLWTYATLQGDLPKDVRKEPNEKLTAKKRAKLRESIEFDMEALSDEYLQIILELEQKRGEMKDNLSGRLEQAETKQERAAIHRRLERLQQGIVSEE